MLRGTSSPFLALEIRAATKLCVQLLRRPRILLDATTKRSSLRDGIREALIQEFRLRRVFIRESLGFKICLNPQDSGISPIIGTLGWWEPLVTELFLTTIEQGQIVLDIGANIGWFTLLASRLVGRQGRILSFEPEATNFALLDKSIQANEFSNVSAFPIAVGDFDGEELLYLAAEPGLHSTYRHLGPSIRVKTCKVDSIIEERGVSKVDLMKVDVEGAEPRVIEGALQSIQQGRIDRIVMEWNPDSWYDKGEALRTLSRSYRAYWIGHSQSIQIPVGVFKEIDWNNLPTVDGNIYFRRFSN